MNIASPQLYPQGSGSLGDVGIFGTRVTRFIEIVNGTHMDPIQSNNCTSPIADGGSCFVEVRANPTRLGTVSATLTAQTPGIPVHNLELSVNFFDDGPRIAIAPNGIVPFAPDQQISFTITNPSSYLRFIDSVTVAAPYEILNDTCPGNVVPSGNSGSCTFTVHLVGSSTSDPHQLLTVAWDEGQQDTVTLVPAN